MNALKKYTSKLPFPSNVTRYDNIVWNMWERNRYQKNTYINRKINCKANFAKKGARLTELFNHVRYTDYDLYRNVRNFSPFGRFRY